MNEHDSLTLTNIMAAPGAWCKDRLFLVLKGMLWTLWESIIGFRIKYESRKPLKRHTTSPPRGN